MKSVIRALKKEIEVVDIRLEHEQKRLRDMDPKKLNDKLQAQSDLITDLFLERQDLVIYLSRFYPPTKG